jgi:hypothetical protein
MAQQGVVEPVEEVGYKNRPPLLEDVSIEGPFRIPIPHALDTLEQREAIEEDYNWWRYSKFALPWLLYLLVLFTTLFVMTGFEQVGTVHGLRNGIPTYFQLAGNRRLPVTLNMEASSDPTEGNMKKILRNVRIGEVWLCVISIAVAFLALIMKPRPTIRKIIHLLCAFVLLGGMSMAWTAFIIGEWETRNAMRCPEMYAFTNERCDNRNATAIGAESLDFVIGMFSLTGAIILVAYTLTGDFRLKRTGWRQQERDAETEGPAKNTDDFKRHNVQITRLLIVSAVLAGCVLLCIAQAVMIVILHQDHNTIMIRGIRGKTNRSFDPVNPAPWEEAGWSARNTRLRYALSGIGILTVLINLLPLRSRVIAYLFAFVYFGIFAMVIVQFVIDVAELRTARNIWGCPNRWFTGITQIMDLPSYNDIVARGVNCINSPYVACAIVDFFTAVSIAIYIINEYIVRYKSIHSQRKYPWFQIRKIEQELDSRRPVRCEVTSEVMTAAEYYYRHRFLTEAEMLAQSSGAEVPLGTEPGLQVPPMAYDYSPTGGVPPVPFV